MEAVAIEKEILNQPVDVQTRLLKTILMSIEAHLPKEHEKDWLQESEDRVTAYKNGELKGVDHKVSMTRIASKFGF